MPQYFLDTSHLIALSTPTDRHHGQAKTLSAQVRREKVALLTTRPVLLELGNAFAKRRVRKEGIRLLIALESDPQVKIVALSDVLYAKGFDLYRSRPDKEWGLTDCISFVLMNEHGLTDALTADEHFRQAGFRALLLE